MDGYMNLGWLFGSSNEVFTSMYITGFLTLLQERAHPAAGVSFLVGDRMVPTRGNHDGSIRFDFVRILCCNFALLGAWPSESARARGKENPVVYSPSRAREF